MTMAQLPTIYTIQASDAPQHTGRLQEILRNLRTEKRIGHFKKIGAEDDLSSLKDMIRDNDLILIVLTNELEAQKERIENRFKDFNATHTEARIAEIIVDNVAYDNAFLTFPGDLRCIRDREDMDAAWHKIEQDLKELFPVTEIVTPVAPSVDWPKYLKIAGIAIGVILIFFVLRGLLNGGDRDVREIDVTPPVSEGEIIQIPEEEVAEEVIEETPEDVPVPVPEVEQVIPTSSPLRIVQVAAPGINCVFNPDCRITVSDHVDTFTIPISIGDGSIQSRIYPRGVQGTPGSGLQPFIYRVNLTQVTSRNSICVESLSIEFGRIVTLDYNGNGRPDHIFVITRGGLGSVMPSSAQQTGRNVTFKFDPGVCSGTRLQDGETSYFFGLASSSAPRLVNVTLGLSNGEERTVTVRAP